MSIWSILMGLFDPKPRPCHRSALTPEFYRTVDEVRCAHQELRIASLTQQYLAQHQARLSQELVRKLEHPPALPPEASLVHRVIDHMGHHDAEANSVSPDE